MMRPRQPASIVDGIFPTGGRAILTVFLTSTRRRLRPNRGGYHRAKRAEKRIAPLPTRLPTGCTIERGVFRLALATDDRETVRAGWTFRDPCPILYRFKEVND